MSEDARPGRSKGQQADLGILDGLVQLSFAIHRVLGRVADAHELSLVQLRLLGILRDREPGMQEIATFLELDKSSVTGLIDRAERRGLVRRASTPDDGRAVRVALTEQGRELTQKMRQTSGARARHPRRRADGDRAQAPLRAGQSDRLSRWSARDLGCITRSPQACPLSQRGTTARRRYRRPPLRGRKRFEAKGKALARTLLVLIS